MAEVVTQARQLHTQDVHISYAQLALFAREVLHEHAGEVGNADTVLESIVRCARVHVIQRTQPVAPFQSLKTTTRTAMKQ